MKLTYKNQLLLSCGKLKEAEKYEAKIDEYTEETAKTFTEMLADARDVLSKEAVSQTTIDSAYVALQQAIFELRLIPNKDKLEALINKVENTDLSVILLKVWQCLKQHFLKQKQ